MPSHQELPTVADHLQAYGSEINALIRPNADMRSGAGYDIFAGTNAILFAREATRDRDLFRALYFDASTGDDVDVLIEERFDEFRVLAGPGTGSLVLERPLAGAQGTFFRGTRVLVVVPGADVRFAEVAVDTPYGTADVSAVVPVRATVAGIAQPLSVNRNNGFIRFEDPVEDPSWVPKTIDLSVGQDRENDAQYKARTKTDRLARRVGYAKSIMDACIRQGAAQVALYTSDFFGDDFDHGVNRCFVGFSSFVSTPELVRACRVAVDAVRMLGADLVVMGMTSRRLTVSATVRLWVPPTSRNKLVLAGAAAAAIVEYFNDRQNAFGFRISALRGVVLRALRSDVHSVDFALTDDAGNAVAEPVLQQTTFTSAIARTFTTPANVRVQILGPT